MADITARAPVNLKPGLSEKEILKTVAADGKKVTEAKLVSASGQPARVMPKYPVIASLPLNQTRPVTIVVTGPWTVTAVTRNVRIVRGD